MKLSGLNFQSGGQQTLRSAVEILPSRVKVAFYAAAQRQGVLKRGTWSGCAFNAAGALDGTPVSTVEAAMEKFGASQHVVRRFISSWDMTTREPEFRTHWVTMNGLDGSKLEYYATDELATAALIEMLETVGIFNEPGMPKISCEDHKLVTDLLGDFNSDLLDEELRQLIAAAEVLTS